MALEPSEAESVELPEDLIQSVRELSNRFGESPRNIVIAAVEHFARISEEQRKAALRATSIRRRGW